VTERSDRGDNAWGWVVRAASLGVFIHAAILSSTPNFGIAFLAICGAAFPAKDFRGMLRQWRGRNGGE
jgi:hypothetical protein